MIRRFVSLVTGFAHNEETTSRQPELVRRPQADASGKVAPDCAIWNDIARALELKAGTGK